MLSESESNANVTRTRNRYRKPVPENLYQFSAGVSCKIVNRYRFCLVPKSGTEQKNVLRRYSMQEIVTKMTSTDWSTVVCLNKLCC